MGQHRLPQVSNVHPAPVVILPHPFMLTAACHSHAIFLEIFDGHISDPVADQTEEVC